MAIGAVANAAPTLVASGGFLNIQPGTGIEWSIHNIHVPNDAEVELYYTDGTNPILVESRVGGWQGFFFHPTNLRYYQVKNVGTSSIYVAFDGIITA